MSTSQSSQHSDESYTPNDGQRTFLVQYQGEHFFATLTKEANREQKTEREYRITAKWSVAGSDPSHELVGQSITHSELG